jgi:hypothetical protein
VIYSPQDWGWGEPVVVGRPYRLSLKIPPTQDRWFCDSGQRHHPGEVGPYWPPYVSSPGGLWQVLIPHCPFPMPGKWVPDPVPSEP